MLNKILKSKVFSNGIYLYILQIFNTVLPLITLPYITRILGDSQYGVFSKTFNYITYCQALVEYGFALAGARKVSLCDSKEERDKVFSNIVYSKMLLTLASFLVVVVLSFTIIKDSTQAMCLFILSLLFVAEIFNQTWRRV